MNEKEFLNDINGTYPLFALYVWNCLNGTEFNCNDGNVSEVIFHGI